MNKSNSLITCEIHFAPVYTGAKMRHLEVGLEIWETEFSVYRRHKFSLKLL